MLMCKVQRCILIVFIIISNRAYAQLLINELMQSNIDCVMDDINEFPDSWVELYNAGDNTINLKNYSIGKSNKHKKAWPLPDKEVKGGEYILIYCDKEESALHTDFRLESGNGCSVYLFENEVVVDCVENLSKQPSPNISYGRKFGAGREWGYQLKSTPGFANCGILCDEAHILGVPNFSQNGFVTTSDKPFNLELSLPDGSPQGAVIIYTIDGSEPTPDRGTVYNKPIEISSTTIIRAKLSCEGWISPCGVCHSYIFFPRELTLPVISIAINDEYLNDSKIGIYVNGEYSEEKENFRYNWRRPINLEYFEKEGDNCVINQLCETRISGAGTRTLPLKSMTVYANKRFGKKNFEHEFFPDQKPGIIDFKSLVFRNAGTDFHYLYMRDAVVQRSMAPFVDLDWQAWHPAIVYINGEYRGILNVRERANENNIYSNYNGLEDVDVIENWNDLKEGDMDNLNQFKAFYSEHGHTMSEYNQWMDCEEFINLMIMNLYFNNLDFPGNNSVMWRPRTKDGRWRWIAKDADFTLGLLNNPPDYNTFEWLYNPDYDEKRNWGANGCDSTRLFRRLMEDEDFQKEFIDKACIYTGDFLKPSLIRNVWDSMYETIKFEYPYHRKLYAGWPNYKDILDEARSWLERRKDVFLDLLGGFYKLGNAVPLHISTSIGGGKFVCVSLNDIILKDSVFDGGFFENRKIKFKELSKGESPTIEGWNVMIVNKDNQITTTKHLGCEFEFIMPHCNGVTVTPVIGQETAIEPINNSGFDYVVCERGIKLSNVKQSDRIKMYAVDGRELFNSVDHGKYVSIPLNKGFYVLRVGKETVKILLK